jgi:hypothetical protein
MLELRSPEPRTILVSGGTGEDAPDVKVTTHGRVYIISGSGHSLPSDEGGDIPPASDASQMC